MAVPEPAAPIGEDPRAPRNEVSSGSKCGQKLDLQDGRALAPRPVVVRGCDHEAVAPRREVRVVGHPPVVRGDEVGIVAFEAIAKAEVSGRDEVHGRVRGSRGRRGQVRRPRAPPWREGQPAVAEPARPRGRATGGPRAPDVPGSIITTPWLAVEADSRTLRVAERSGSALRPRCTRCSSFRGPPRRGCP